MLCCLLIAALGGPFVLWAGPRTAAGKDCCVQGRRVLVISALALIALCSVMLVLAWSQPAPFRHICSFLVAP